VDQQFLSLRRADSAELLRNCESRIQLSDFDGHSISRFEKCVAQKKVEWKRCDTMSKVMAAASFRVRGPLLAIRR